jgi:hypothetical protein
MIRLSELKHFRSSHNFDWQAKLSDYINFTGYTALSAQNFNVQLFPISI